MDIQRRSWDHRKRVLLLNQAVSPLLTDLISYWKFDETSGTRVDSVGGNNLSTNGTVNSAAGKISNAVSVAGTGNLSVASNSALQTGDIQFTFATWAYSDLFGAERAIAGKYTIGGSQNEWFLEYGGVGRFIFTVSSNGTATSSVTANSFGAPTTGVWYYIVVKHDSVGNTISIQVNNGTVDSVAYSSGVFVGTSSFRVCDISAGGSIPWRGRVDESGFWKRLLTAGEITQLYNSGNGLTYPFT